MAASAAKDSSRIDQLLKANSVFAQTWPTPPTMVQMRAASEGGILVLTCMDPRVVPEQFFPNARIAVFRNAGGRYSPDVVRTAATLRKLMGDKPGAVTTVIVVHHTDCGMTHLTNKEIQDDIVAKFPAEAETAKAINFGCFTGEDLVKSIKEDVEALKAEEILKGIEIVGFALDTVTGLLSAV
ncbi:hypothetical protein PV08_11440 [Exophiala spinifera]|uniref:Carbonic anhydrase n=1 Tax=Exophiala spinifera TaxID=91928 RepID=A0A0D1Y6I2_9EURO|nr:uncharacterized protein PV08_11440 [Exophiala spinifera]KIW10476.1 hypothetical protein PV08_11440 [Exophiala spinifera]